MKQCVSLLLILALFSCNQATKKEGNQEQKIITDFIRLIEADVKLVAIKM